VCRWGNSHTRIDRKSIADAHAFLNQLSLTGQHSEIALPIMKEFESAFAISRDVGLEYITLDRTSSTLSGGEGHGFVSQRKLARRSPASFMLLDEPSIGLHPRDNRRPS